MSFRGPGFPILQSPPAAPRPEASSASLAWRREIEALRKLAMTQSQRALRPPVPGEEDEFLCLRGDAAQALDGPSAEALALLVA